MDNISYQQQRQENTLFILLNIILKLF